MISFVWINQFLVELAINQFFTLYVYYNDGTTMTATAEEAPEISRIPARFRNSVSLLKSHLQTLFK